MTSKPNEIVMMHEESSSKSSNDCCGEEKKMSDGCGGADDQVVRNEKLPTDLMASREIIDYVIDINIYRHLLKIKILYLRKQFINYGLMYFNYIRPLTKTKFNNNRIIENRPNQNYRLLHSYNSLFLNETKRLLHVDQQTAFTFCKTIVTSSLEMLIDVGLINNLIHDTLWEKTLMCPVFKKGDRRKVKNYRGITLLNTGYKVLSLIILKRLERYAEETIGEYQSGFRKGRSTIDHIFVVRQLMEKHYEYAKDLHMVFVDYKQAYDSVNREKLWEALKTFRIPLKIIKMVQLCNSETYSKVKIGNEVSMAFEIKSGLRQGDAMSPILFNMALESVVREMSNGDAWSPHRGLLLAYADDIIITGNTRTEVQMNLKKLMKASKNMGLLVNEEKMKCMAITRRSEDSSNLKVENKEFEQVKEFKYLGVTLNNKNIMHEEINVRLNAANRCYFAMETIFKSKLISKNVKEKLYISYIRPVLTYACAT